MNLRGIFSDENFYPSYLKISIKLILKLDNILIIKNYKLFKKLVATLNNLLLFKQNSFELYFEY